MNVDAAADAFVWGYPLVTMHRTRAQHQAGPGGRGGLVARDRLSTAADRTVVAPNNDTLYSSGWFDLCAGDLTIDVGVMDPPDRYWSVMLLDAYTHVTYVCRRLHGAGGAHVRVTYDPSTRPAPDTAPDVVPIATPTVWVLARVLVDGPGDLGRARAAQARIRVAQGSDSGRERSIPHGNRFRTSHSDDRAVRFFGELRDALAIDPPAPWHPPLPPIAEALLRDTPAAVLLAEGARRGAARIRDHGAGVDRTTNGWGTRTRGADFGDDVTYRAAFASVSLAGHLPAENRSYSRRVDGSQSMRLRFPPGGEPPAGAFWSLSLYGLDMFFVGNRLDRYSVGDRTPGLRRAADGSLTVTIGHDPPADTRNWLPAPDGPSVLVLRAYEGAPEIVDATWFPPDLVPAAEGS